MKKITLLLLFAVGLGLNAANLNTTFKIDQSAETIYNSITSQNDYELRHFIDSFGVLHIAANTKFEKIVIYNVIGQSVLTKELSSKNVEINVNELKTGIYIANISINGERKAFKLVKK